MSVSQAERGEEDLLSRLVAVFMIPDMSNIDFSSVIFKKRRFISARNWNKIINEGLSLYPELEQNIVNEGLSL